MTLFVSFVNGGRESQRSGPPSSLPHQQNRHKLPAVSVLQVWNGSKWRSWPSLHLPTVMSSNSDAWPLPHAVVLTEHVSGVSGTAFRQLGSLVSPLFSSSGTSTLAISSLEVVMYWQRWHSRLSVWWWRWNGCRHHIQLLHASLLTTNTQGVNVPIREPPFNLGGGGRDIFDILVYPRNPAPPWRLNGGPLTRRNINIPGLFEIIQQIVHRELITLIIQYRCYRSNIVYTPDTYMYEKTHCSVYVVQ